MTISALENQGGYLFVSVKYPLTNRFGCCNPYDLQYNKDILLNSKVTL